MKLIWNKYNKQLYNFVGYKISHDIIHNISEAIYLTLALSDVIRNDVKVERRALESNHPQ